jgi:hypothetical protein
LQRVVDEDELGLIPFEPMAQEAPLPGRIEIAGQNASTGAGPSTAALIICDVDIAPSPMTLVAAHWATTPPTQIMNLDSRR